MNMSTHVQGIVPPNNEWKKKKAAFDACEAAGVDVPSALWEYFEHEKPDESGIIIDIDKAKCVSKYNDDSRSGIEVDLSQIDPKIKIIRFVNSY